MTTRRLFIRLRRRFRRPTSVFQPRSRRQSARAKKGLTLIDMAFAVGVAATTSVLVVGTVANALELQVESERLAVATALAQTFLAQEISKPGLSTSNRKQKFGKNRGIYSGYSVEVDVKEKTIDLAEVQQTGTLKGVSVDDQLPPGTQNTNASGGTAGAGGSKSAGSSGSQTGGRVDIVHIKIIVKYPRGRGRVGTYRVETYRGSRKRT